MIQTVGDLRSYLNMFYDNQPLIVVDSEDTECNIKYVFSSENCECVIELDCVIKEDKYV